MLADIIIDLKSQNIDKPFTYRVPDMFLDVVDIGERCYVEFGNQKRMGYIINIRNDNNDIQYKDLIELIDFEPILTKELIDLAHYLSKTSFYPLSSYLSTMVPSALKGKYGTKYLLKNTDNVYLRLLFAESDILSSKEIDKIDKKLLYKSLKNGDIELVRTFDTKESIKYEKMISLLEYTNKLTKKRLEIVDYIKNKQGNVSWNQLKDDLKIPLDTIKRMEKDNILKLYDKEVYRDVESVKPLIDKTVVLTKEQDSVYKELINSLSNNQVYLLHGVTGSGKTEIYLKLIEEVINRGKDAIVLVPEISLTPMMVNRVKSRFGKLVSVFHSGLNQNTKYDEWRRVIRGESKIAIGARSAVFAPFKNLGLIIIDEEHEQSYKQENSPIYHARDVAEVRMKTNNGLLLLGSATPSIESYSRCLKNVYRLLELKSRPNNSTLPQTKVIDLSLELKKGSKSILSNYLIKEIEKRLLLKEQTLLLINRRGYSNFIMCRECGNVPKCPNCDVSLTYHKLNNKLVCHYCGYELVNSQTCLKCGSHNIDYIGYGTEKIEQELKLIFKTANIIRMDRDTTKGKNAHEKLLYDFEFNGDILIGTQMIAKGLDYPNITLVGVLNIDQSLKIPDFRSKETTFELLTQVAGRAGRGDKEGLVVVQTYNENQYAIKYGLLQDYQSFFNQEMKVRKIARFSPFYNIILIKTKDTDLKKAYYNAVSIKTKLEQFFSKEELIILGPLEPTIGKIDKYYIFNLVLKFKILDNLYDELKNIFDECSHNKIYISIDRFPTSF